MSGQLIFLVVMDRPNVYITPSGNQSHEISRVTLASDQALFMIHDAVLHSVSDDVLECNQREVSFMQEYYQETGIHWRANYGPNRPRPPPVLHMWSVLAVGQLYRVMSTRGYWKCYDKSRCQSAYNSRREGARELLGMGSTDILVLLLYIPCNICL